MRRTRLISALICWPFRKWGGFARYTLLPYWYTVFWLAYSQGLPVMRALWSEYPKEEATFAMDDQWLIGSDLLVKPVTTEGE